MVRTALEKMVDWKTEDFLLEGCFSNGQAALDFLKKQPVDLVITDMKMPVCDGLELMRQLRARECDCAVVVLSAFNEFSLVKQAFQLGAADYLLKAELCEAALQKILRHMAEHFATQKRLTVFADPREEISFREWFAQAVTEQRWEGPLPQILLDDYAVACFYLQNLHQEITRFGPQWKSTLAEQLGSLVYQLPRFRAEDAFACYDATRYFLFYPMDGKQRTCETALSAFTTVQTAWKNYMNLCATVGVAFHRREQSASHFFEAIGQAEMNTTLRYVFGPGAVYAEERYSDFNPLRAFAQRGRCIELIHQVMEADFQQVQAYANALFARFSGIPLATVRREVLLYLFNLYYDMGTKDIDIADKIKLEHCLYQRVMELETLRELQIYFCGVTTQMMEYIEYHFEEKIPDQLLKSKRWIDANYMRADFSLAQVAAYAGYHEKYFSTLFKRAYAISFSEYLIQCRISAACQLLDQTDMKIYQIAEATGYNNVEHFVRMFKKNMGLSPAAYRKNVTKDQ